MKETCPVCGAPGKIVGHTTKHFEREEISVERIEEIIHKWSNEKLFGKERMSNIMIGGLAKVIVQELSK